ncbi:MAG: hypothetical protein FJ146_02155 [Deltaproteobacteria bacterium]|nr:hypothetical protein [Deltaproteobacteria bacterium]
MQAHKITLLRLRRAPLVVALVTTATIMSACKPRLGIRSESSSLASGPDNHAISLAGVDSRDREQVHEEQTIRLAIAKTIMGLDPKSDDRHDHIGLINIAELMGFELPFNDCGRPWIFRQDGDQVVISSQHSRGVGASCRVRDSAAPVSYSFSHWSLEPEAVYPVSLGGVPEAMAWPRAASSSNANTSSAVTASLDDSGALKFLTRETVLASVSATSDVFTHRVNYERTIPLDPSFTKLWQDAAPGLQIMPGDGGGATFNFGPSVAAKPRMARVSCSASVLQNPGCNYRVYLTATHLIHQQKYRAMVNLYPKIVNLTGRLRGDTRSMRKPNIDRQSDGSREGAIVSETFGKAEELDFIDDLTEQVTTRSGNWSWEQMRALPLAQKDGVPTLDWALRYFTGQEFGGLSYDFLRSAESVQTCVLHVEVMPDSKSSCQSLQDGAVVEPNVVPIL